MVNGNPVVRQRPHVLIRSLRARPTPRANEVPLLVELKDGVTGLAALGQRRVLCQTDFGPRSKLLRGVAMHNPNVVLRIHIHTNSWPHEPVVRQVLRPQWVDLKHGHLLALDLLGRLVHHRLTTPKHNEERR